MTTVHLNYKYNTLVHLSTGHNSSFVDYSQVGKDSPRVFPLL